MKLGLFGLNWLNLSPGTLGCILSSTVSRPAGARCKVDACATYVAGSVPRTSRSATGIRMRTARLICFVGVRIATNLHQIPTRVTQHSRVSFRCRLFCHLYNATSTTLQRAIGTVVHPQADFSYN